MSSTMGPALTTPSFSASLLPELLLGRGWLSPEQITEALAEQRQSVAAGHLWTVNAGDYILRRTGLPEGEPLIVTLPDDRSHPPVWRQNEWVPWGTGFVALFDANTCEHIQDIHNQGESVGLAVVGSHAYVHTPSLWQQGWAAQSNALFYEKIPLRGLAHLPLDMTWAANRLYLADRGAGIVHGVDAVTGKYLGYVAVRPAGSKKAIHVAPLPDGRKFYVTDNSSAAVWLADTQRWRMKRLPLTFGPLGNIVMSADGQWLFVLTIKPGPTVELLILEARNLVLRHAVQLRGEPFSQVDDPCDLLALSPNGQYLVVMTYVNRPKLLTPLVSVIDIETPNGPELMFEYTLDEETKPTNLAWWSPHPQPMPSLIDIIADKGWIDRVALTNLHIEAHHTPVQVASDVVLVPVPAYSDDFPVLDQYTIDPALLGAFPEKALRAYTFLPLSQEGNVLTVAVVDAANERLEALFVAALNDLEVVRIPISQDEFDRFLTERYPVILAKYQAILARHAPPAIAEPPPAPMQLRANPTLAAADPVMVDETCAQAFMPLLPADRADEALPDLFAEAARLREVLTITDRTAIQLPQWGITHDITQRWLLEALSPPGQMPDMHDDDGDGLTAPDGSPLTAGVAASMRAVGSPEQLANLPGQTVLLCDAEVNRVVELGPSGESVWQADSHTAKLTEPRCASRLASGNTLISDGDRVIEVSRASSVFSEIGAELKFSKPHRSTRLLNGHTLIADRGQHRVLELDDNGKVIWQYGFAGSLGITVGRLYSPCDLQRLNNGHTVIVDTDNHRIIEVDTEDRIVWQFGNANNKLGQGQGLGDNQLDSPMSAWRFSSGKTLIVDSGNRRILEISPDGKPLWIAHIPAEGSRPMWAWRLADSQTIVSTDRYVFQVANTGEPVGFLQFAQLLPPSVAEYIRDEPDAAAAPSPRLDRLVKQTAQSYAKVNRGELGPLSVVLIDRVRNRLFEINRHKQIVWRIDEPASPLDLRLNRPQMVELIDPERVLITDTDHHRVIEIQKGTKAIIWQYGKQGVMGSGPGQLGHPRGATLTAADTVLIADGYTGRVLEVNRAGDVIWSFGGWDDDLEGLTSPYHAQRLADGNTLITDWSSHQVMEVDAEGLLVWRYGQPRQPGSEPGHLMYPEQAIRLPSGTTMIVDTRNSRIIEVDPEGSIVWQYGPEAEKPMNSPTQAQRLDNGHTVIVHGNHRHIIEVDPLGEIVWQYGLPPERRGA
ncbi:MAG: PQQ-binding-like beta-propeller repeat protein [Candidatus Sericytochromatia bacterium]|nr:PQQ-binding-like beta-propeller repeat protein [Candidatus Sericytochromatia bacterium]